MKSKLSKNNHYWISKFRYLELKNWCRQYPEWRTELNDMLYLKTSITKEVQSRSYSAPTEMMAIRRSILSGYVELIEQLCIKVYPNKYTALLEAVTYGRSYDILSLKHEGLCSRAEWYKRYREFFWRLSQSRD